MTCVGGSVDHESKSAFTVDTDVDWSPPELFVAGDFGRVSLIQSNDGDGDLEVVAATTLPTSHC